MSIRIFRIHIINLFEMGSEPIMNPQKFLKKNLWKFLKREKHILSWFSIGLTFDVWKYVHLNRSEVCIMIF